VRESLRRILTLVAKEFAAVLRDPKSRFVVIGPPIIQFFVFGYAATFDVTHVRYAVLDEARTPESRALLARFDGSEHFALARTLSSDRQIPQVIDPEDVRLVLHVPADFSSRIHAGQSAPLQVILDGRNSNVASIAAGYVGEIVRDYNVALAGRIRAGPRGPVPALVDRAWFNENLLSRWYIVSALGGLISAVVVTVLASLSVAREREFGTFDQLLVAPFRSWELLVGKAAPGLLFGLLDSTLLSLAAVLWFGVPFRGSVVALTAALLVFVFAIVGVGLFISSLATTMQQALLGSFVFLMPAVVLAGLTTPIENMPMWLQRATLANPLRYVIVALRRIFLEGDGVTGVWPELWPLAIMAVVTLSAAAWLFRNRSQ
jgi:ABC-2 type transport system permease protein